MQFWLELSIAWRYVRSRESGAFVTFISWVSVVGIALGVAALICILSVMNGFEAEARARLLKVNAHVTLSERRVRADKRMDALPDTNTPAGSSGLAEWIKWVKVQPGVLALAPCVNIDALMIHDHSMEPAKIRGIDPSIENHMGSFNDLIVEGSAEDLQSPEPRMIIGRELALQLGVAVGDTLQVLVPETQSDGQLSPRLMEWRIVGQFEAGLSETDGVWAWVNQDVLKALAPHATTELRVRLTDATLAPALRKRIEQRFGPQLNVTDWTLDNATYFRATHLEKLMMTVILSLIVAVAIFNVVAMLVMVVRSKRLDIAVIRTLGMSPQGIQRIFMWQGLLIGWGGAVLGLLMGLLLATHTAQTAAFIERLFHFQILSSEVYYITEIPSRLQWTDVGVVMALALSLALWATLSPSRRAAETLPSEVLRYDQ